MNIQFNSDLKSNNQNLIPHARKKNCGDNPKVGRIALGIMAIAAVVGSGLVAKTLWFNQQTNLNSTNSTNSTLLNIFNTSHYNNSSISCGTTAPSQPDNIFNSSLPNNSKISFSEFIKEHEANIQRLTELNEQWRQKQEEQVQQRKQEIEKICNRENANIQQWTQEINDKQLKIERLSTGQTRTNLVKYNPQLEDEIQIFPPSEDVTTKIKAKDFEGEGLLTYYKYVDKEHCVRHKIVTGFPGQCDSEMYKSPGGWVYEGKIDATMNGWSFEEHPYDSSRTMLFFYAPWTGGTPLPSIDIGIFHENSDIHEVTIINLKSDIIRLNEKIGGAMTTLNYYKAKT